MKKFTAILVAIVLALFVVSCGDSEKEKEKEPDTDTNETDTVPDDDECEGDDCGNEDPCEPNPCEEGKTCKADAEAENGYTCAYTKLDDSIIEDESNSGPYFAFKGVGRINDAQTSSPDFASFVEVALKGIDGKDLDYATDYSFFLPTTLQGQDSNGNKVDMPSVAVEALGDPNMTTGRFTTIAFAAVPIDYIEVMKENDIDRLPTAPITQIIDILYTSDDAYVRQCMLAVNKYGNVPELGGEAALGEMQVAYGDNKTFAVGETFKLAMRAELAVGQEIVDMYSDVDTLDDLCTCFDMNAAGDDTVDCSTIPEFNGQEPEPECDAETEELKDGKCECKEGFEKNEETKKCEKKEETDPCKDVTCENEGEVCVADAEAENGYKCEVPSTPEPTDPCDPNPCEGEATCTPDTTVEAGYTCTPATPEPTDPCDPNPCEGEATCTPDTTVEAGYICMAAPEE